MNVPAMRVLLAEDSPSDADVLQELLHQTGPQRFEFMWVQRLDDALARLRADPFDVLLLDLSLPDSTGADTFRRAREAAPSLPIVVLTGAEDERLGLEAIRHGVQDYLVKGRADGSQIARAVRYAVERVKIEEALRQSEERYRALFDSMTEAFAQYEIVYDERAQPCDYRFAEINPAFERLTGLTRADVIGRARGELESAPCFYAADAFRSVATSGESIRLEAYMPGLKKHFAAVVYRPAPDRIAVLFHDVTERKVYEAQLQKLNRTLKALSESDHAMLRATDEPAYLQDICRIIAEDCGHVMVWIGFAEDDAGRTVRPVVHAGFDEGYLEKLNVTWADTARGRGPTGTAVRAGKVVQCANMLTDPVFAPWRAEALKRGYASSLAVPLLGKDRPLGAITIYSRETDPFTAEEIQLLTELAGDVTYGLTVLRMRAARAQAEKALQAERDFVSAVLDTAGALVAVFDRDGRVTRFNRACEKLTGYTAAEVLGRNVFEFLIPPDEIAGARQTLPALSTGSRQSTHENHWLAKDGARRLIAWSNTSIPGKGGDPEHFIATGIDITERKQAEEQIRQRVEELRRSNAELDRFNRVAVGREERMIELKKEVNELCRQAGLPRRYPLEFDQEPT